MPYSDSISSPSTLASTFPCGPGFWAMIPEELRRDLLVHQLGRARRIIAEHELPVPDDRERFELLVMLTVEADMLFFNAALFEPSPEDCDLFFSDFLRHALRAAVQ